MSLLARELKAASEPGRVTQFSPSQEIGFVNGMLVPYADNTENYVVKGYMANDLVYSIVKLITDKVKVAPWGLYKVEDEQAYKSLLAIKSKKDWTPKDFKRATELQEKALKPATNVGKWGDLIKWPNDKEPFSEFVGNGIAYKLITGNKFTWARILEGGANAGVPYDLNLMPSQYTEISATREFPAKVTGYKISCFPGSYFKPSEVCHEKYFNPAFDISGSQLYGMAPLKAALQRLKKSNDLTKAESSTFQNEGVKGVLYMKNKPGEVDGVEVLKEVRSLKQRMISEWQGPQNRGRIGISGYEIDYIPIGLTSEEMEIIQTSYLDLRFFCNIWGVPSQLMNDPDNKVYNNSKEGEKALTSRCAIPELNTTRDQYNRQATRDWGLPKGTVLDYDITCYPELQADIKEVADWTGSIFAISPNEQRELCGLAALPEKEMSQPWVKTNDRTPLSDFQLNAVDNALNNGDGTTA